MLLMMPIGTHRRGHDAQGCLTRHVRGVEGGDGDAVGDRGAVQPPVIPSDKAGEVGGVRVPE